MLLRGADAVALVSMLGTGELVSSLVSAIIRKEQFAARCGPYLSSFTFEREVSEGFARIIIVIASAPARIKSRPVARRCAVRVREQSCR